MDHNSFGVNLGVGKIYVDRMDRSGWIGAAANFGAIWSGRCRLNFARAPIHPLHPWPKFLKIGTKRKENLSPLYGATDSEQPANDAPIQIITTQLYLILRVNFNMPGRQLTSAARSKAHFLKFENTKNNLTHAIWASFFLKFSRK